MPIYVWEHYNGANEMSLPVGVYDENDPRLKGLAQYLVDNDHANIIGEGDPIGIERMETPQYPLLKEAVIDFLNAWYAPRDVATALDSEIARLQTLVGYEVVSDDTTSTSGPTLVIEATHDAAVLADNLGIDLDDVAQGVDGKITEVHVQDYADALVAESDLPEGVHASAAAVKLAAENNLDLADLIGGSGKDGTITVTDVRAYLAELQSAGGEGEPS